MTDALSIEIKGLKETQKAMTKIVHDLNGPPMVNAMRDATLAVTRDARKLAPVDTGRLRASITPEVIQGQGISGVRGIVGSNVEYAPYVELRWARHKPPTQWHYLQDAVRNRADYIYRKISAAVQAIVSGKG